MRSTRLPIVLCLVLGTAAPGAAEDRRPDPAILTLMTFNAEFLWDGVAPEEGQVQFPWKGSQTEAEEHMLEVAEVIIRNNPDVVNLVEVESLEALTAFNDKFLAGRGYRPYLVKGRDTFTGQDVALLTRIDPEGSAVERDDRQGTSGTVTKSVSKNYHATLRAGDTTVLLVGLHLLAQPNREDRRAEREAQAEAMRSLVLEKACAGCGVVVWGDFNDYEDEPAARDHVDSAPITNVLRILRERAAADPGDDLVNAASFLPKAERYTAHWDQDDDGRIDHPQELTSIDHVLLSPDLAADVEFVSVDHTHTPPAVSDHFPVIVRLRTNGIVPGAAPAARIVRLLPNPPGDENRNEELTVANSGTAPLGLAGWTVRDLAGATWSLSGVLAPGEERVFRRDGQRMALNNGGDTIDLLDPTGRLVHSVSYASTEEGQSVVP